jgi:hypothetical protein
MLVYLHALTSSRVKSAHYYALTDGDCCVALQLQFMYMLSQIIRKYNSPFIAASETVLNFSQLAVATVE